MDRYYSRKTISKPSKKRQLVTGLEFDPTDVNDLKSTKTSTFDVAKAVYKPLTRLKSVPVVFFFRSPNIFHLSQPHSFEHQQLYLTQ